VTAGPGLRLTERLRRRAFAAGVALCTAGVGAFTIVQLAAWPPHEDETLALFVGRSSFGDLLHTVLNRRGGAPLHFVLAWIVVRLDGGLLSLRFLSALFATASVPVIALLGRRLAGWATGLVATAVASASWILLFHGVYGRMYSLFLFSSALSYLALLVALDRGGLRAYTLWVVATLATIASHPYGALVLGSQGVYVLLARRRELREPALAAATVLVLGIPFWRTDLVLAGRFDVGVGAGGSKLSGPLSVLSYLRASAGDFSVGWTPVLVIVLLGALGGLALLWPRRRTSALLVGAVIGTPTAALMLARFGSSSTSPESRHLIFVLPFFSVLVAMPLVELARRRARFGPVLAACATLALLGAEVGWAEHKTPLLFRGEPAAHVRARADASAWLAATSRPDDVLFGYDPLYLDAWERNHARVSQMVVPRADPKLALDALARAPHPLGRGVWVFDAYDTNNFTPKLTIPYAVPEPHRLFEARVFGSYLVIRTRARTVTALRYLEDAESAQLVGQRFLIGDADVNLDTARKAIRRLVYARSRSTVSR
jgi:hypothetical protein